MKKILLSLSILMASSLLAIPNPLDIVKQTAEAAKQAALQAQQIVENAERAAQETAQRVTQEALDAAQAAAQKAADQAELTAQKAAEQASATARATAQKIADEAQEAARKAQDAADHLKDVAASTERNITDQIRDNLQKFGLQVRRFVRQAINKVKACGLATGDSITVGPELVAQEVAKIMLQVTTNLLNDAKKAEQAGAAVAGKTISLGSNVFNVNAALIKTLSSVSIDIERIYAHVAFSNPLATKFIAVIKAFGKSYEVVIDIKATAETIAQTIIEKILLAEGAIAKKI